MAAPSMGHTAYLPPAPVPPEVSKPRGYARQPVASAAPLPQPMLLPSGSLPPRGRSGYEVKWDGFRCLLNTENGPRAISRRGWDMTDLLPELASFPAFGMFDGELVAFDTRGNP